MAANQKLIIIQKSGAASQSVLLDIDMMLSDIREILKSNKMMNNTDFFLNKGSQVLKSQEKIVQLQILLVGNDTLVIGAGENDDPIGVDDGVQHYNGLNESQKKSLFLDHIQIFKGLSIDSKGFHKTFHDMYEWKDSKCPKALMPRVISEVFYQKAFSKVTHTFNKNSVDESSVSLDTPYGGGEAEYKHEKSKETSTTKVTEYITGKFILRKVRIRVEMDSLILNKDFETKVIQAIKRHPNNEFNQYYSLLEVLNEWGYYVPTQFTLGGMLYSSDHTTIKDYSESETRKKEYGGSFKAAFKGIGGGASYKHAEGSTQSTTTSDRFQITSFSQIGGKADTSNDYSEWAKSLDKAIYWNVASYEELVPVVALLKDVQIQNTCLRLMNKYNSYSAASQLQPTLNMRDYATKVESYFASPWG